MPYPMEDNIADPCKKRQIKINAKCINIKIMSCARDNMLRGRDIFFQTIFVCPKYTTVGKYDFN